MFLPKMLRSAPVPAVIFPLSRALGTRSEDVATDVAALALVIAKSEELVLPNGSANSTSELVPVYRWERHPLRATDVNGLRAKFELDRSKIERRSVDLVGA